MGIADGKFLVPIPTTSVCPSLALRSRFLCMSWWEGKIPLCLLVQVLGMGLCCLPGHVPSHPHLPLAPEHPGDICATFPFQQLLVSAFYRY